MDSRPVRARTSFDTTTLTEPRDHAVHFYDDERELIDSVAEFVIAGLRSGDAAIVVATTEHVRSVEMSLAAAEVDVAESRADGSLIVLDAAATLSRVMRDGRPDAQRFDSVVGDLLRRSSGAGRQLRVYGEMVAVLWDAGDIGAAMELEEMWNELRNRVPFSLLCGYPLDPDTAGRAGAVAHVCDLHSAQSHAFPCTIDAPSACRRFVAEVLRRSGNGSLVDDASIVVAELAANAVVHASSEFVVSVMADHGVVRITVRDRNPIVPVLRNPSPGRPSGRGLRLIDAIARAWGIDRVGRGKVVWVELAR